MNILGVRIDNLDKKEISQRVENFLLEEKFHQIATVNPEFILEAQKNVEFKKILNDCDLNIADGMGIGLAFWRYRKKLRYRLAGADLLEKILRMANRRDLSVFLAANERGLSNWQETKEAVLKRYPNLIIDGDDIDSKNDFYQILSSSCQIVFCNFGAPNQELFLRRQKNDRIRLAVGVGGSFEYITGKIRRAPRFWRFFGLEWFWRLILQPKRWRRIFRAVIVFPIKIIINH